MKPLLRISAQKLLEIKLFLNPKITQFTIMCNAAVVLRFSHITGVLLTLCSCCECV